MLYPRMLAATFSHYPYIKCKTYKTSSNSKAFAEVENLDNSPVVTSFPPNPSC